MNIFQKLGCLQNHGIMSVPGNPTLAQTKRYFASTSPIKTIEQKFLKLSDILWQLQHPQQDILLKYENHLLLPSSKGIAIFLP